MFQSVYWKTSLSFRDRCVDGERCTPVEKRPLLLHFKISVKTILLCFCKVLIEALKPGTCFT